MLRDVERCREIDRARELTSAPEAGGSDQRGSALLVTMLTAVLVSGLAAVLVVVLSTEEAIEANHRRGVVALYAADGVLTEVVAELADVPDWQGVLSGSARSTFSTGPTRVSLADGAVIDLRQETRELQRAIERVGGAETFPRWRLYAWGWFADLIQASEAGRLMYVAVWVRDDLADPDTDPGLDTNGRVVIRAVVFGPFRTRRTVEAAIGREGGMVGRVRIVAWGLVR